MCSTGHLLLLETCPAVKLHTAFLPKHMRGCYARHAPPNGGRHHGRTSVVLASSLHVEPPSDADKSLFESRQPVRRTGGFERASAGAVRAEMLKCYSLIEKLGRGVVYLGSARILEEHPHFQQAVALSRDIGLLLGSAAWSGIGSGMMEASVRGAVEAKVPVGGFKIVKEAGGVDIMSWTHAYLPRDCYLVCRFYSARKHGLVDAAMREQRDDLTAFVALPGGVGTMDELFEILTLFQLERLSTQHPVPFLMLNYDGCYNGECLLWFWMVCTTTVRPRTATPVDLRSCCRTLTLQTRSPQLGVATPAGLQSCCLTLIPVLLMLQTHYLRAGTTAPRSPTMLPVPFLCLATMAAITGSPVIN
eukprot:jgi/Mesvir1/20599/Mv14832-RA.1